LQFLRTMRIAIPVCRGRVSPVFDVASQLLLVDLVEGQLGNPSQVAFPEMSPLERVERLRQLGVNTLLCGGISQPLEEMLVEEGIRVFARLCGDVEDILAAYVTGQLGQPYFAMPGCRGRHGPGCHRRRRRWAGQGPFPSPAPEE